MDAEIAFWCGSCPQDRLEKLTYNHPSMIAFEAMIS